MALRFIPIGAVRCGSFRWNGPRGAFASIAVEASFRFGLDGAVTQDPHPPALGAQVPYLPRGEILFHGSARKDAGPPSVVRLAVFRGAVSLVDKRLVIRGAAAGDAGGRVRLEHDRGVGGPGDAVNPRGSPEGRVVNAANPRSPASYAPLPAEWPARRGLLRPGDEAALAAKPAVVPHEFPVAYFHRAPADQRAPSHFAGDETILLEGLVAGAETLRVELPRARAEALCLDKGAAPTPVHLVLDTIAIDGDARRIELTWRGYVEVSTHAKISLVVAAGVALRGEAVPFPRMLLDPRPVAPGVSPRKHLAATAPPDVARLAQADAPFAVGAPREPRGPDGAPEAPVPWTPSPDRPRPAPATPGQHATLQQMTAMPDLREGAASSPEPAAAVPAAPTPAAEPASRPGPIRLLAPLEIERGGRIVLSPGLGSEFLVAFVDALNARSNTESRDG